MRLILIGLALTFLALPALAIGNGDCCADVNGVCISVCNKTSCTGNGDCDLALTSAPVGVDPTTRTVLDSLRTMSQQDQAILDQIFAGANSTGAGGRPDGEPIHFIDPSKIGDFTTPDVPTGVPTLVQTAGNFATVPMEHGSCGVDCGVHVLATHSGNLEVPFEVTMTCPWGEAVNFVAYQLKGLKQVKLVEANTGNSNYTHDVTGTPFSLDEIQEACQEALGGSWALPGSHENDTETVKTTTHEAVEVWGQCTGGTKTVKRTYPVALTLTCADDSWSVPVP